MNKQVFFGKNVAQNTASSADLLADGEAGIFGINSATFQTEKVAGGSTYDKIWIAMGRASGRGSRIGRAIDVLPSAQEFDYKKMPYSPAVKETKLVSITCDGSKGVYDVFALRVNVRFADDIEADNDVYAATYYATGKKFATARAVYDEWAAQVNNQSVLSSKITVTATDAGLLVTPVDARQVVEIGGEYYDNPIREACATCSDCDFVVETQNEYDAGSGTLAQITELVRESAPYSGVQYNLDRNIDSPLASGLANVGTAFPNGGDILYIKWKNRDQPKGDVSKVFNVYQEIFLVFPPDTNTGALESVLNTVFNTTIKTSLAS